MNHCFDKIKGVLLTPILAMIPFIGDARESLLINDGWKFLYEDSQDTLKVNLPHCWNDDAYRTRDYRRGTGIYTKQLSIPERFSGQTVYIKLDGAANKSKISIDGKEVGQFVGAYSSHVVDITPYVTPGQTHELTVEINNSDKNIPPYSADFTFMGGLYRDAWLTAVDPIHLELTDMPDAGFKIETAVDDSCNGRLKVSGVIARQSQNKTLTVNVKVSTLSGRLIADKKQKIKVKADRPQSWTVEIDGLKDLDLWSPELPMLYRVDVELIGGKEIVDNSWCDIAFRTFGFDESGQFLLNGKPYKLRGMCRHQDQKPMGIALDDEMHRRDMELIKNMGANFVRISHYPQDDAVLEMCDRLGLIVWEEIPVIDYVPVGDEFADNSETMLRDMIRKHYNHPSIVMWGYMNEILLRMPGERRDESMTRTLSLAQRLENVLKEEDPTRLSAMAFHGSDVYHEAGLGEITGVKGWNLYQGWYGGRFGEFESFLSRQHREHPDHKLIVSEYGAGSDLRLHSLEPEAFDFSIEYQQEYLEHYLPVIEDSVFVAGASHWNFIDFSSANRAESMPHINNKGLVTNDRRPKDVYYYYQAAWTDPSVATVAHIAARDWADRKDLVESGKSLARKVKAYSNLPAVAMKVNGKLLPVKSVDNFNVLFDVALRRGDNIIELLDGEDGGKVLDVAVIRFDAIDMSDGVIDLKSEELAINVGSNCYFRSDLSGMTWLPDREYSKGSGYGYVGGKSAVSQDEIALTDDQPLLQRCRSGLEQYRVDVADGIYEVELSFADLASPSELSAYMLGRNAGTSDNQLSSMDITINGNKVEEVFAPGIESGVKTAVKRRYQAEVANNEGIVIEFNPAGGISSLSALKLRKL